MSGPGGNYPPPPPVDPPEPESSGGSMVGGVFLGLLGSVVLPMVGLSGAAGIQVPFVLAAVPTVLGFVGGIVLATRPSTRRLGVGFLIGLASGVIVLAGLCVALLVSLGNSGFG